MCPNILQTRVDNSKAQMLCIYIYILVQVASSCGQFRRKCIFEQMPKSHSKVGTLPDSTTELRDHTDTIPMSRTPLGRPLHNAH